MPPDSPTSRSPAPVARAACAWRSCSAEFGTFHQLAAHLLSAHIDCESANSCEWYLCDTGGHPMPSRMDLISHLKTHTGNRSYLCPVDGCGKVYKRSDFLAKHINTHSTQPAAAVGATAPARLRANHAADASDASSFEDAPLALISNAAATDTPQNPTRKRRRYRRRQQPSPKPEDDDDDSSDGSSSSNRRPKDFSVPDMPESERQAAMLEAQLAYIRDQVSTRKELLVRNKTKMRRLRLENDILIDALART
ncbi:hypothetical protein IW140_003545 [Coemansia sp. RSA 1813]|nr:hypothetical protein EV178_003488 [Coemansia sp. RSA 1646]KAJ1769151.1 hypothetical protein LPJ74_004266 [Coemansia sp. RSA 1843]KAJ2089144.1 hypothetical protein IW138_003725 [Coemansia sp. RSA 986]KAJ2215599.1 hypothetical protein EV179_002009 [Coemansia sp. RSA 487]KAJ2568789.1 hypothetical protein IW140_003545 [Coemansia sp. RSA 1813]